MRYELRWTLSAHSDLVSIEPTLADRIIRKVTWFCIQSNPMRFAERLTGQYADIFRFRVGDYRILFEKNARGELIILMILRIKHRRDAYR